MSRESKVFGMISTTLFVGFILFLFLMKEVDHNPFKTDLGLEIDPIEGRNCEGCSETQARICYQRLSH